MEFHPEKRNEILAKREKRKLMKSHFKKSARPIGDDSPLAVRLRYCRCLQHQLQKHPLNYLNKYGLTYLTISDSYALIHNDEGRVSFGIATALMKPRFPVTEEMKRTMERRYMYLSPRWRIDRYTMYVNLA